MRKYLILAFFALFIGCSTSDNPIPDPTYETPTTFVIDRPVWIKNAKWETVRTDELKASSRGLRVIDSLEALQEEIDAHNAAHPENPWHLYVDTVPSIEDAPMCEMWIADPVTNAWKTNPSDGTPYHLLVARSMVTGRVGAWEMDAAAVGGKLYIDYPPPPVVEPPVDTRTEYEKWSCYVVDSLGFIIFESHITEEYTGDPLWPIWKIFEGRVRGYEMECAWDGNPWENRPWHVVQGQLYTEPE